MHDSKKDSPNAKKARSAETGKATRQPKRGRPVGDRETKRKELLSAAIAVIANEGYAGTSMRKVAKQAGHTTGAVTYYFANKEELVSAVAQNLFDQFDATLDHKKDAVDVKAIIQEWLDWTGNDDSSTWLAVFQLLAHARHEPAFADVIKKRYSKFRKALARILVKGQEQGVVRKDIKAELLADQLSAISDGWLMMLPIEPERFKPARSRALLEAVITLISPH
jgi:AcrR family transcriptional regulator